VLSTRRFWLVVSLAALVLALRFVQRPEQALPPQGPQTSSQAEAPHDAQPTSATTAGAQPSASPASGTSQVYMELPKQDTRAARRVLVRAKYGPSEQELGKEVPPGEGEVFPPQGFTPTPDGGLLVLDSAKQRLVWYDAQGRFLRAVRLHGLVAPADVAMASDGTIVVVDHQGVQTKGMLLLDPAGKKKADLPQLKALSTGMYTVGNDIYVTREGLTTIKAGDTSGSASDETPELYSDEADGSIPGHVAPDGRTVVSAGIDDEKQGKFFVTSIRGNPPVHQFSRYYVVPGPLLGIPFVQSDAQGDIYVVLYYAGACRLVCIDGKNGDPLGAVALPSPRGQTHGTPFRKFSVVPEGGILYQELSDDGSVYEWFNCF
jgi:hypothetical protein